MTNHQKIKMLSDKLKEVEETLLKWQKESVQGGWSTHQVAPQRIMAASISEVLYDTGTRNEVNKDQVEKSGLKREFLHVQIDCGQLYIYSDDTAWQKSTLITLANMNTECCVGGSVGNKHFRIPLKDFLK